MTIACNMDAFDVSERTRYCDLAARIRSSLIQRNEISEGFVFDLSDTGISSSEMEEWISNGASVLSLLVGSSICIW